MKNILFLISVLLLLFGCKSSKDVVYMQDAKQEIGTIVNAPQIRIKKDDLLAIFVSHKNSN